jgi:hypothetical protein
MSTYFVDDWCAAATRASSTRITTDFTLRLSHGADAARRERHRDPG